MPAPEWIEPPRLLAIWLNHNIAEERRWIAAPIRHAPTHADPATRQLDHLCIPVVNILPDFRSVRPGHFPASDGVG